MNFEIRLKVIRTLDPYFYCTKVTVGLWTVSKYAQVIFRVMVPSGPGLRSVLNYDQVKYKVRFGVNTGSVAK